MRLIIDERRVTTGYCNLTVLHCTTVGRTAALCVKRPRLASSAWSCLVAERTRKSCLFLFQSFFKGK